MPTVWWLSCLAFRLSDTCKVSFPWAGLVVEPGGRRFWHFLPLQTPENWLFSWLLLKNLSFTVLHCTCRQVSPDLGMGWGQVHVFYRSNRTTDIEPETFTGWNILNFICILQRCPLKPFIVHAWWLLIQAGVNSLFILFFPCFSTGVCMWQSFYKETCKRCDQVARSSNGFFVFVPKLILCCLMMDPLIKEPAS